ncbi:hint-domain-containing protein [Triangularia verruculosa]|uniref:Hint-domain-containing protein n=1 Tax=Triangularia verruculosa TaxID=2587418 RepID=A0AAN7ASA1_9PEZI|nr:hint-domain-containing protein [Triangularia verruculosa]
MVRINLCNLKITDVDPDSTPTLSREKDESPKADSLLQIHPLETDDGVLIKIDTPKEPEFEVLKTRSHVPLDLVLSIDVSGSMGADAPVPAKNGAEGEHYGLSVLDLVRHAAKTILETLDEDDRLGIVTFSTNSKVVRQLTYVTKSNKAKILKELDALQPLSMTNLWHGIRDGLSLFDNNNSGNPGCGRVPALLVLTDGMPNHQCPSRGYVAKLRQWDALPASIHTFGFGYSLRSGLLKSIAEVGGGNYSFIPDAGMIGTVFVHAVANLQSTFATNVELQLTYPSHLQLKETTGEAVEKQQPIRPSGEDSTKTILNISLGNLQYGQSREIYLRYDYLQTTRSLVRKGHGPPPTITAVLKFQEDAYSFNPKTPTRVVAQRNVLDTSTSLPNEEIAYQISRSLLIAFIAGFFPLDLENEHQPAPELPENIAEQLENLACSLPAIDYMSTHAGCKSLLTDLCGLNVNPFAIPAVSWTGQIALALVNRQYYFRWGKHYLPSLAGAHSRQICNSFKDAGPKEYGVHSPLFIKCRDRLDDAFDNLPAPRPSNAQPPVYARPYTPSRSSSGSSSPPSYDTQDNGDPSWKWYRDEGWKWGGGGGGNAYNSIAINMSDYNDADGACFAGFTLVTTAGGKNVTISKLRRGMAVLTPRGKRRVVAVMKTPVRSMAMVAIEGGKQGFLVTGWHPIRGADGKWVFPVDMKGARKVRYTGAIYSVLLERDGDAEAHAMLLGGGGVWGVTLGHGMTDAQMVKDDVRVHEFFGDYDKVGRALSRLQRLGNGLVVGGGVTRDPVDRLVNGFRRAVPARRQGPVQQKCMKQRKMVLRA